MASDPKNRLVTVEVPLGGKMMMTKGLADHFVLQVQQGFPFVPIGKNSKIGGTRNRSRASGKALYIKFKTGAIYKVRYEGTFKRCYGYLREVAATFNEDVEEVYTERKGSRASMYDSVVPES